MTRRFTGRHMALIMVGFFGVVIGVNAVMATAAIGTFGGSTVENSYIASQKFDGWLTAAREQAQMGWRAQAGIDSAGKVRATLTTPDGPLGGATVAARAEHPLGRLPSRDLVLRDIGDGSYVSDSPLPAGRWHIRLRVAAGGKEARFAQEVRR